MNPSCLAPPIAYPREFTGDSSQFHQREVPFHQVYRESRDPYTSASFYHMGLGSIGDFRKVYNVKCAGGDNPFSASNIIVSHFDSIGAHQVTSPGIIAAPMNSQYAALHHHYGQHNQLGNDVLGGGGGGGGGNNGPGSGNNGNGVGVPYGTIKYGVLERDAQSTSSALAASRACTGLYCLSAHRIHAGLLPNLDGVGSSSGSSKNPMNSIHKEVSGGPRSRVGITGQWLICCYVCCVLCLQNYEGEDIRLAQNYFSDRKGAKLTKSKLQVTSALMLPLRRLLLIGTEDGLVRVVS
jgi:hypothetical protein